jgi:hypothetical protein
VSQSVRVLRTVAVTLALAASSIQAQTVDASRLVAGIAAGKIGGAALWSVPNQPIKSVTTAPDIFALERALNPDVTVSGNVTYFPTAHVGFTGEFSYLGLQQRDRCTLVQHNGDRSLATACDSVAQTYNHSAAVTIAQVGVVLRPFVGTALQPFVKATGGLAFVPSSTNLMSSIYWHQFPTGTVNQQEVDSLITIYPDPDWRPMRLGWVLAAGFVTAPTFGLQLKVEARETWMVLSRVTGATIYQGINPPVETLVTRFTSVIAGFDLVFAKRRGRRY